MSKSATCVAPIATRPSRRGGDVVDTEIEVHRETALDALHVGVHVASRRAQTPEFGMSSHGSPSCHPSTAGQNCWSASAASSGTSNETYIQRINQTLRESAAWSLR